MPTPYKGGYGVRYPRTRYKQSYWRKDARKFIQKNFHAEKVRRMLWWKKRAPPTKVGWTAKTAKYGTIARAGQQIWRHQYFKKHGRVI